LLLFFKSYYFLIYSPTPLTFWSTLVFSSIQADQVFSAGRTSRVFKNQFSKWISARSAHAGKTCARDRTERATRPYFGDVIMPIVVVEDWEGTCTYGTRRAILIIYIWRSYTLGFLREIRDRSINCLTVTTIRPQSSSVPRR